MVHKPFPGMHFCLCFGSYIFSVAMQNTNTDLRATWKSQVLAKIWIMQLSFQAWFFCHFNVKARVPTCMFSVAHDCDWFKEMKLSHSNFSTHSRVAQHWHSTKTIEKCGGLAIQHSGAFYITSMKHLQTEMFQCGFMLSACNLNTQQNFM